MPAKTQRPRSPHGGYTSEMNPSRINTKPSSAKVARNRNRVTSAKPAPVGRRGRGK